MCGIAGATGFENVVERLYSGIRALEYRGYDSCGIAVLNGEAIALRKDVGPVQEVGERERFLELSSQTGIAHTRWATHGGVTRENAHPHLSGDGAFAVVHNGIIDNYREIRERLRADGHVFRSETDTEVIAHLLESHHRRGKGDVLETFEKTLAELRGNYAIAVISTLLPERILCAKHRSPLILGLGDDANYVGSDFNAFIERTKRAVILEDEEFAVVSPNDYFVRNRHRRSVVTKRVTEIAWDAEMAKKGGFPHYMLKEMHEQPQAIRAALQTDPEQVDELCRRIEESKRVFLAGVGTTHYVSMAGQYLLAQIANRQVTAISTDEFAHLARPQPGDLFIAISQSGETYDTLEALRFAKEHGATTAAIVNVIGSSLARDVDVPVLQMSGPEISVISTKAAMAQIVVLTRIAARLAARLGGEPAQTGAEVLAALEALPAEVERFLNERSGFLNGLAKRYADVRHWLFLGRGVFSAIAFECALKMKEVAYVHAEGMPAGFLKHGTLALVDDQVPCLVFYPPKSMRRLHEMTVSSAHEVRARDGRLVAFSFEEEEADDVLLLPPVSAHTAPLLQLVAGQLFSYFCAVALERNIDRPRSLAKSVTVP